jgi:hypothetical protein
MTSSAQRNVVQLSENLTHRLNLYALAATAAGIGALATTPTAEAKIIYTKTNQVIISFNPPRLDYYLDVNNDGVADFYFWFESAHSSGALLAFGFQTGHEAAIVGYVGRFRSGHQVSFDSALPAGRKVEPKSKFHGSRSGMMADFGQTSSGQNNFTYGPWAGKNGHGIKKPHYLGLKFAINGKVHYGWARFTFTPDQFVLTLKGYAYESVPNKAIITGKTTGADVITVQPGSLGQLARGKR